MTSRAAKGVVEPSARSMEEEEEGAEQAVSGAATVGVPRKGTRKANLSPI